MSGPLRLVQWLFRQLYTTFAFLYDFVAHVVSFGEWQEWGATAIQFARGDVLELGHGPGHVLRRLAIAQRSGELHNIAAIDLSPQMTRRAAATLLGDGFQNVATRADAARLPFAAGAFDCVISTFPAPYIFAPETLHEVQRVLRPDGELIVVPHARLAGRGVWAMALRWLYAITGQRLAAPHAVAERVARAGLSLRVQERSTKHAVVTVWLLRKIA